MGETRIVWRLAEVYLRIYTDAVHGLAMGSVIGDKQPSDNSVRLRLANIIN